MTYRCEDAINNSIQGVYKVYRQRLETAFNQIGLHPGQEMMLMKLWDEEGITQSQLVERVCVDASTVTKSLQRLEKVGLVERRQDTEDSRVSRVYLTEQGRALREPVEKILFELESKSEQNLSDIEIALMRRLLDQIYNNLAE